MGKIGFSVLLICGSVSVCSAQMSADSERESYFQMGQLEELAMCHHAIMAAHYDGKALNQNPYYRYILNSPGGRGANVYPIPERCKNGATNLVLAYTNMKPEMKAIEDKMLMTVDHLTVSDVSSDAQFLTVVINKIELEGNKATLFENKDKNVP